MSRATKTIEEYNFKGKRALIRVDFNVPLSDSFEVEDKSRIVAALPTIKKVLNDGGAVILCSHLGRPKEPNPSLSLKHLLPTLREELSREILFAPEALSQEGKEMALNLKEGEVLLLENIRFYPEEEGKIRVSKEATEEEKKRAKEALDKSRPKMAKELASYADYYINDAFGTAHRAHLSTALVADYFGERKMFGYLMEREIEALERVLSSPQPPITAIVGGAKISSKIGVVEKLFDICDTIIIGGGMAFTFIKALGGEIGESLFEPDQVEIALKTIGRAKERGVELLLPEEVIIAERFSNDASTVECRADNIPEGWFGLDTASSSIEKWQEIILNSKTVLWNGPVGVFEMETFAKGTNEVAQLLAQATERGAFTLVGGGDSVAAINKFNLQEKISYISTGGGAMLEYLQGIELPGIAAIKKG